MTGTTLYVVTIWMLLMGVAVHWLKGMITARRVTDMQPISVGAYWGTYWPESLVALFSSIAGYVFLIDSHNLTALNAFGIGYIANSLADMIGNRVQAMITPGPGQVQPPNGTRP
jgi:hypothetical protein